MDKTVEQVFNQLTEEEKQVVYYLVGAAVKDAAVKERNSIRAKLRRRGITDL